MPAGFNREDKVMSQPNTMSQLDSISQQDKYQSDTKRPPNILLIVTDQLRYDCIGSSGRYPVATPNLDRLASRGRRYTNAYSPIPTCCPARQTMMCGRTAESLGAYWNYDMIPAKSLTPEIPTFSSELKRAGYSTSFIGKWHVSPDYSPLDLGYDTNITHGEYHRMLRELGQNPEFTRGWLGEENPLPLELSETHWLADKAIGELERLSDGSSPWHLSVDFNEPHLPCRPSRPFSTMYDPRELPRWQGFDDDFHDKPYIQRQMPLNWRLDGMSWEDWSRTVALYYGIISQTDDAVGRILDRLDSLGAAENTLVIFTSDHGDMCGSHHMIDKHYVLYDDVVHVPLIISWKGKIAAGEVERGFVNNCLDLAPTILEAAGIESRENLLGKSLLCDRSESRYAYSTFNGQQFGLYTMRMIRGERWKYIWNTTDIDELYDLENDPGELYNLIRTPELLPIIVELRQRLYERLTYLNDPLVNNGWLKNQLLLNLKQETAAHN